MLYSDRAESSRNAKEEIYFSMEKRIVFLLNALLGVVSFRIRGKNVMSHTHCTRCQSVRSTCVFSYFALLIYIFPFRSDVCVYFDSPISGDTESNGFLKRSSFAQVCASAHRMLAKSQSTQGKDQVKMGKEKHFRIHNFNDFE